MGHRARDAGAAEPRLLVAQIDGFAAARRGAGRSYRTAAGAAGKRHLRLDGGAATGIPHAPTVHFDDLGAAHARTSLAHAARIASNRSRGRMIKERATARTRSLSCSSVTYSIVDLPSIRARKRAGSKWAIRASISARGSQATPSR